MGVEEDRRYLRNSLSTDDSILLTIGFNRTTGNRPAGPFCLYGGKYNKYFFVRLLSFLLGQLRPAPSEWKPCAIQGVRLFFPFYSFLLPRRRFVGFYC